MYLSQLKLQVNRLAMEWVHNPYRVHQRLAMACEGDPRVLFRIEEIRGGPRILVQSHFEPHWDSAFGDWPVLKEAPASRVFEPVLSDQCAYRFRLLANPVVKRNNKRLGLLHVEQQQTWLRRKLTEAGAELVTCTATSCGLQKSFKQTGKRENQQTHLAVLFEGVLLVRDQAQLMEALASGIGSAKGYGMGLLSLGAIAK